MASVEAALKIDAGHPMLAIALGARELWGLGRWSVPRQLSHRYDALPLAIVASTGPLAQSGVAGIDSRYGR